MGSFCDEHNIKVVSDGIGNTVWLYKDVEIAYYMDMPEPEGRVYVACKWFVNKRERDLKIRPVYFKHGYYQKPEGASMKLDDGFVFDICHINGFNFQMALLNAIRLLEPRLQILKGKITMLKKHRASKYNNFDAIGNLTSKQIKFIEGKPGRSITLCNGNKMEVTLIELGKSNMGNPTIVYNLLINEKKYLWVRTYWNSAWCTITLVEI